MTKKDLQSRLGQSLYLKLLGEVANDFVWKEWWSVVEVVDQDPVVWQQFKDWAKDKGIDIDAVPEAQQQPEQPEQYTKRYRLKLQPGLEIPGLLMQLGTKGIGGIVSVVDIAGEYVTVEVTDTRPLPDKLVGEGFEQVEDEEVISEQLPNM